MIDITKLYCGEVTSGDNLRYDFVGERKPIVVWNSTRRCNLNCIHCYSDSRNQRYDGELSTVEGRKFIDDIAEFGGPVLLFSGGEPFLREDLFELGEYAVSKGLRTVISTNGTLITKDLAQKVKNSGFSYVGISLDGIGQNNDRFRGKKGAFDEAVKGFRNCVEAGQKVGLRLTLTKHNAKDLPEIFDFIEEAKIDRACFYHLVYTGRGSGMKTDDLTHAETRQAVDYIVQRTVDFHKRGIRKDILTVDNHTDGVYLYLKMKQEDPARAEKVYQLLKKNGGNMSGIAISCVDNQGNVHADQFWGHYSFGNVRKRKFGEIWTDTADPLMAALKNRKPSLKGRCRDCQYLEICNGNFRVRAEAIFGDVWAPEPACYLTDEEIGITQPAPTLETLDAR